MVKGFKRTLLVQMKTRKLENFKSKRGQQLPQSLYLRDDDVVLIHTRKLQQRLHCLVRDPIIRRGKKRRKKRTAAKPQTGIFLKLDSGASCKIYSKNKLQHSIARRHHFLAAAGSWYTFRCVPRNTF